MFFGGRPGCAASLSRRMHILEDLGLVAAIYRPGNGHTKYYIAGPRLVREIAAQDGKRAQLKSHLKLTESLVTNQHFLMLNDILSFFRLEEYKGNGELLDWRIEREIQFAFKFKGQNILIKPDASLTWLDQSTLRTHHSLLEVDRSTERLEIITSKCMKYLQLLVRLAFARVHDKPVFPLVLFIARTPSRAASICGCIKASTMRIGIRPEDVSRFARFGVTDLCTIEEKGILAPIWRVPLVESQEFNAFVDMLPPNHLCHDLRQHFPVENRKWSRAFFAD